MGILYIVNRIIDINISYGNRVGIIAYVTSTNPYNSPPREPIITYRPGLEGTNVGTHQV